MPESDLVKMGMALYVRWVLLNATVEGLQEKRRSVKFQGRFWVGYKNLCEYKHLGGIMLIRSIEADTSNMLEEGDRAT